MPSKSDRVLVLGAGPAGIFAALRAAELGAPTTLVTSGAFGGMAAADGPVPVRALAHAARLMREAQQMPLYGINVGEPRLDYPSLLGRIGEIVRDVREHAALRPQLEAAGVAIHEHAGPTHFVDPHLIQTDAGQRFEADRIIVCTGGVNRTLPVPGFGLLATHRDALSLTSVPPSMIVIGGGATGLQVASIFAAFGTQVELFEAGDRILPAEEPEVSAQVAAGFRARGIVLREGFGAIEGFEPASDGIRMTYRHGNETRSSSAALGVSAVGWCVDADALQLSAAGIELHQGFIEVDEVGRTSTPHIFAAGDAIGGAMLVPQAIQEGFVAASAALGAEAHPTARHLVPLGSFTDPEYARVGDIETTAAKSERIVASTATFAETTRTIIDGRTFGFCKLIADAETRQIIGCSVVGDRAVDIVQVAAVAMAGRMDVDTLANFQLSFPIYAGILSRTAIRLTQDMDWRSSTKRALSAEA
ncbi:dihydrolipoyl dehydrogenase family protein [Altererythrobacter sp. Root672]|uniref:dihydrolipoyl dehydrogenase family protein n=1 Tax=Altererythrobacter sp. Root672 TaxID=1736584 RepID=UPI0007001DA7|nr:NAD(P)/FAD-dependent oxidoreductase [Altererythrobacter sp. Root672]KRA81383.1 hypothetical protein ASD76_12555 [Altererythrobacter sp. Root672]